MGRKRLGGIPVQTGNLLTLLAQSNVVTHDQILECLLAAPSS